MATKLLSTAEVGQVLGIKQQAARNWLKRHGLPIIRVNQRTIRVREQDLDAWLESHRDGATLEQLGYVPQITPSTGAAEIVPTPCVKYLKPWNER